MRGEVTVEIRTDNPEARFEIGSKLQTDPANKGPLKIHDARFHSGTLLLTFEGFADRNSVETLRNVLLLAEVDPRQVNTSEDDFHISQIVGCAVVNEVGANQGTVKDVLHLPAQDTLVIDSDGREILIPFVREFVPTVDIERKMIIVSNMERLQ